MQVLNIEVPGELLGKWKRWLAPRVQPFFLPQRLRGVQSLPARDLTPELRDTYRTYNLKNARTKMFLDEARFMALSRRDRGALVRAQVDLGRGAVPTVHGWKDLIDPSLLRGQADGHRFVWWPSLLDHAGEAVLERFVATLLRPSLHGRIPEATWRRIADFAPRARGMAGRFPASSGPNCFGAVMGATGEAGAEHEWVHQPDFEAWLSRRARRRRRADEPGTILLWRDTGGVPRHAALTLLDGWGLEKPSQDWFTPWMIVPVADIVRENRTRGLRLERWTPAA